MISLLQHSRKFGLERDAIGLNRRRHRGPNQETGPSGRGAGEENAMTEASIEVGVIADRPEPT